MIDVLIQGKLRGSATVRQSQNGNAYATFMLAAADKNGESMLCSCITFSADAIEAVEPLEDGDSAAVSGEAAVTQWKDKAGNTRNGLDVKVYQVMSAYHAGRKRAAGEKGAQA